MFLVRAFGLDGTLTFRVSTTSDHAYGSEHLSFPIVIAIWRDG